MGQNQSRQGDRTKAKKHDNVLRVPQARSQSVKNKFYSAPRLRRTHSGDSFGSVSSHGSRGIIIYTSAELGQPVAQVVHPPRPRPRHYWMQSDGVLQVHQKGYPDGRYPDLFDDVDEPTIVHAQRNGTVGPLTVQKHRKVEVPLSVVHRRSRSAPSSPHGNRTFVFEQHRHHLHHQEEKPHHFHHEQHKLHHLHYQPDKPHHLHHQEEKQYQHQTQTKTVVHEYPVGNNRTHEENFAVGRTTHVIEDHYKGWEDPEKVWSSATNVPVSQNSANYHQDVFQPSKHQTNVKTVHKQDKKLYNSVLKQKDQSKSKGAAPSKQVKVSTPKHARLGNTIVTVPTRSQISSSKGSGQLKLLPPTGRKKELIPDPSIFDAVDARALKCPEENTGSVRALAKYLTKVASTDLERIRGIFYWMARNIRYDVTALLAGAYRTLPSEPMAVLQGRRAVGLGFANLFAALCKEVDIQVLIISGFGKGYQCDITQDFQSKDDTNHAWNLVHVHGEWRPLDCASAAGFIDESGNFYPRFNEVYFLTDPDRLICSHFPFEVNDLDSNVQYQLMAKPVALHAFNKMMAPSQAGAEWGVEFVSHKQKVIHVDNSVRIDIRAHRKKLVNVICKLKDIETGESCDRYVVPRRKSDGSFNITVYPPQMSTYTLKIYGETSRQNNLSKCPMVSYILKCMSSIAGMRPFPENDGVWGVKVNDAEKYGFVSEIYNQDFYATNTGFLEFKVGMVSNVTTMMKLSHAEHEIPDLHDHVIGEYSYSGMLVKARFPKPGYYKLSLYAKPPGSADNRVDLVAVFLVNSKSAAPNCVPFPKTFPFTQDCMCRLVEPTSGYLPSIQRVRILIRSDILQRVLVDGQGSPPVEAGLFIVEVEPKGPGQTVSIFGNKDGGPDHDELYRFTIIDTRMGVDV